MAKQYNIPNLPKDYSDASQIEKWMSGIQKLFQSKNDADNKKEIEIKDSRFPVGSWYVQYPSAKSNDDATAFPENERPATLFGGTWTEKYADEYVFFRTAGTNGQTRTDGLSEDQIQGHFHNMYYNADDHSVGAISGVQGGRGIYYGGLVYTLASDGTNGKPRVGSFTEPRNRIAKYWYRES